jgi:putative Mg2+ transporter-C (MgtC) family protein
MLSSLDIIIRLSLSFVCGLFVGLERQLNNRIGGIHTCVLVCVGSCLFIFVGSGLGEINSPSRIAAQVVTGIGFIGSGVIIKDVNQVKGLNTAATIWCCSAIGCLCGCGLWLTGACSSIIIAFLNYILRDSHIKYLLSLLLTRVSNEEQDNNV